MYSVQKIHNTTSYTFTSPMQATGSQIGILFEAITAILLSLLISLFYSWSLTCLIVGVLPFLLAGGFLQGKAGKYFATKKRSALEQAGKVIVFMYNT